jgi:hypothetical protein
MSNMPSLKNDRSFSELILNGSRAIFLGSAAIEIMSLNAKINTRPVMRKIIFIFINLFNGTTL